MKPDEDATAQCNLGLMYGKALMPIMERMIMPDSIVYAFRDAREDSK